MIVYERYFPLSCPNSQLHRDRWLDFLATLFPKVICTIITLLGSAISLYFPLVVSKVLIQESWSLVLHRSEVRDHGFLCSRWGCLSVHFSPTLLEFLRSDWPQGSWLWHDCEHDLQWIRKSSSVIVSWPEIKHKVTGTGINPVEEWAGYLYPSWAAWSLSQTIPFRQRLVESVCVPVTAACRHTRQIWKATDATSKHSTVRFIWLTHTHKNGNYTHGKLSMYCRNVEEK